MVDIANDPWVIMGFLIFIIMFLVLLIFLGKDGWFRSLKATLMGRSGLAYTLAITKAHNAKLVLNKEPTEFKFEPRKEDGDITHLAEPFAKLEGRPMYLAIQGVPISIDPTKEFESSQVSKLVNQSMIRANLLGKIQGASMNLFGNKNWLIWVMFILLIVAAIAAVVAAYYGYTTWDKLVPKEQSADFITSMMPKVGQP